MKLNLHATYALVTRIVSLFDRPSCDYFNVIAHSRNISLHIQSSIKENAQFNLCQVHFYISKNHLHICEVTLYGPLLSFMPSVMVFHNHFAILRDVIQEVMSSKLC